MKIKIKIRKKIGKLSLCFLFLTKECQSKKKEQETRKCFKCDKEGHIAKDCKGIQSMKKQKIQEELEEEDDKEDKQSFGEDLE